MGTFGGFQWDHAADTGRIRPGRGPYFTRRVFPTRLPVLRKEALADGVPRRVLDQWLIIIRGVLLPEPDNDRTDRLGPLGHHGDPGPHHYDIITRARALWLLARDAVVCGWAAAAFHGLVYWADCETVGFYSSHTRRARRGLRHGHVRTPTADLVTCRPDPAFPQLRVVDAATAAAECLATIRKGTKSWWVPEVPGLDPWEVQSVQFIDAFRQCTELSAQEIIDGGRRRVKRSVLEKLVALSDDGAQSPMETVLRLIVRDMLPTGHMWTSQVTIPRKPRKGAPTGEVRTTTPDLACTSLKVALYYDGAHHDGAEQTDTDFRLFQELIALGWEPIRVNKELLADRETMLEQIASAITRANRRAQPQALA